MDDGTIVRNDIVSPASVYFLIFLGATTNFSKVSDSLAKANIGQTVKKLENSLANVDKIIFDIHSGKGTMGKLLKDEAYLLAAKSG